MGGGGPRPALWSQTPVSQLARLLPRAGVEIRPAQRARHRVHMLQQDMPGLMPGAISHVVWPPFSWFNPRRSFAMAMYSGFSSMSTARRPCCLATRAVVPLPPNGSSTRSPGRLPARMHGSTRSGGKVAKCAPLKGFLAIVHTERRFLFSFVTAHRGFAHRPSVVLVTPLSLMPPLKLSRRVVGDRPTFRGSKVTDGSLIASASK